MKSKSWLKKVILAVIVAAIAFLYYYIKLPAINIHSQGFWGFLILLAILLVAVLRVLPLAKHAREYGETPDLKHDKPFRIGLLAVGGLIAIFLCGLHSLFQHCKCQKIPAAADGGRRKLCR